MMNFYHEAYNFWRCRFVMLAATDDYHPDLQFHYKFAKW